MLMSPNFRDLRSMSVQSACIFISLALNCSLMKENDRKIKSWKILAARLLHPIPVFLIVTSLAALVYTVPNLRRHYESGASAIPDTATVFVNILLPIATGLIAALGIYFGLYDLRKRTGSSEGSGNGETSYSEENRIRSIARHLPIAVITLDKERSVTYFNPAASDLLSSGATDINQTVTRFIDSIGLLPGIEEVFKGSTVTVEKNQAFPEGPENEQTWKVTGVPITRRGTVVEALLLIEDRTQYRLLEDELIRSEDRYRNIFNHAPCGIFFTDSQGNYLDANPSALQMLGYSLEELSTLSTRELSADSDRRLRRLRETPGWIEEETRYLRKDGKVVEAELQASSYLSGKDTYFIGIAKDVTAKKELERNLAAARARLKAVLSMEGRPLLLVDDQDHITNVNSAAAEFLGSPADQLLGTSLKDLIAGDPPPVQDTSSAVSTPCTFTPPGAPPMDLSIIRLPLGSPDNSGSLLLLSEGPIRVEEG